MAATTTLVLGFSSFSVNEVNGDWIQTSINSSLETLGILVDQIHAVPDRLVLGTASIVTTNIYLINIIRDPMSDFV